CVTVQHPNKNAYHDHPSTLYFFFNDTPTTEIYTLSLHDALPILQVFDEDDGGPIGDELLHEIHPRGVEALADREGVELGRREPRSEEHTSELQSQSNLVCRLLLEKKKKYTMHNVDSPISTARVQR